MNLVFKYKSISIIYGNCKYVLSNNSSGSEYKYCEFLDRVLYNHLSSVNSLLIIILIVLILRATLNMINFD